MADSRRPYVVTVTLTDGRHRSLVIAARNPEEAISRAWRTPRWAVIAVTDVRRWVAA